MRKIYALLAAVVMLTAAGLRVAQVEDRSLSHPEMYIPRLPLPAGLSDPAPRFELIPLIRDVVAVDTHPPGYYSLMWLVTRVFGADTWSIRLPSVVFGVATVAGLLWLGFLLDQPAVGLLAAGLLALNGYHAFWSQIARMYVLSSLLAVVTTDLLLMAARPHRRAWVLWLYGLLTIFGLSVHVYFWPFFLAHIAWVVLGPAWRARSAPAILGVQALVAILGSPLLAVAAYQSRNTVATLSREFWWFGGELLQFGFLTPHPSRLADTYGSETLLKQGSPYNALWFALLALSLLLVFRAFRALRREDAAAAMAGSWPRAFWFAAAAALAFAADLALLAAAGHVAPKPASARMATRLASGLPWAMLLVTLLLPAALRWLPARLPTPWKYLAGPRGLVFLTAFLPLALLSIFSIALRPVLAPRGCLSFIPLILYVLAWGIVDIVRGRWALALMLAAALTSLCAWSLVGYAGRRVDPLDERRFALRIRPEIAPSDRIFYSVHWSQTPIVWYLRPLKHQIVASNFAEALHQHPGARVWVLRRRGASSTAEMIAALSGYHLSRSIGVDLAPVELWEPSQR